MSHLPQKCIARECTNLWVMEARYLFELKKLGKRIFEEIFWQLMKQDRTLLNIARIANAVSLLKGHYGTLDDSLWKLRLLFKRLNSQKWHHVHKSSPTPFQKLTITTLLILLSHLLKPLPRSKLPPSSQFNTPVKKEEVFPNPKSRCFILFFYLELCCFSPRTWCRRASGWCPCSSCSRTWGSWWCCRRGGGRRAPRWTPPFHSLSPFQQTNEAWKKEQACKFDRCDSYLQKPKLWHLSHLKSCWFSYSPLS